jgi:hypothetical protein
MPHGSHGYPRRIREPLLQWLLAIVEERHFAYDRREIIGGYKIERSLLDSARQFTVKQRLDIIALAYAVNIKGVMLSVVSASRFFSDG